MKDKVKKKKRWERNAIFRMLSFQVLLPFSLSFFHCIFKFFISLALLCGMLDLVPQPGIIPMLLAVEAQSPNHWTAREVLPFSLYTPFS